MHLEMGQIVPPFRQLYQESVSDLQTELKAALVDLGHKSAFDLLLKEAWNPEVAEGIYVNIGCYCWQYKEA